MNGEVSEAAAAVIRDYLTRIESSHSKEMSLVVNLAFQDRLVMRQVAILLAVNGIEEKAFTDLGGVLAEHCARQAGAVIRQLFPDADMSSIANTAIELAERLLLNVEIVIRAVEKEAP